VVFFCFSFLFSFVLTVWYFLFFILFSFVLTVWYF
jgi:hypothetical protein